MKIIEKFNTIQGEGKYLGVPSYFIRTTGCNLRCQWRNKDGSTTICDTPYSSWKPERGEDANLDDLINNISKTKSKHVVITGGEPTLMKDLPYIANGLISNGYHVTVETNGTIYHPNMEKAFMSISPKLMSSYAQQEGSREATMHSNNNNFIKPTKQWMKTNDYQLKFVYNGVGDQKEISDLVTELGAPRDKVYLMPQGITEQQFKSVSKELFNYCMKEAYNYSPRMHIDVFGNKRGI